MSFEQRTKALNTLFSQFFVRCDRSRFLFLISAGFSNQLSNVDLAKGLQNLQEFLVCVEGKLFLVS